MPYRDNLYSLVHERSFRELLPEMTWLKVKGIIRVGNLCVHTATQVTRDEAAITLRSLFEFIDWIDYSYGQTYDEKTFDDAAIPRHHSSDELNQLKAAVEALKQQLADEQQGHKDAEEKSLDKIRKLSAALTAAKEQNQEKRHFQPENISEFKTRKMYIDVDLKLEGWRFQGARANVLEELPVSLREGDGTLREGQADYVLMGRNGKPLAVVEAKRTCKEGEVGKEQAVFYADALEQVYGQRPFIFYTNGFETTFWDDTQAPPRRVSGVFGEADLQRLMTRRTMAHPKLSMVPIDDDITDRPYQKEAIRAVCESMMEKRRKFLLVMATGTGKTRTAASLVDVLTQANVVTNVLYLADRRELVKQSKESFRTNLPYMSLCNLCKKDKDEDPLARVVFSTYPTILNAIDEKKSADGGRLYSPGHFDLIIIDESHRSIFKKYRAIFDYFDAMLLGLTATPKTDVDRNTYDFFDMETGDPTFAYSYQQAIDDHYLVPYYNYETQTKFLEEGIQYDDLSDEDKERFEDDFVEDDGAVPDYIPSTQLNRFVFNEATVETVLDDLMTKGIRTAGGDRIGKTIIFAENKRHAQFIVDCFDKHYPQYAGKYALRVVCDDSYVDRTIDRFKRGDEDPYVAVSVDMLDTGIDVPEIVNLVFFKKVRSRTKFWQMIGRGTRRCDTLDCVDQNGEYDGKKYFYIFDYCSNFEYFRQDQNEVQTGVIQSLTEKIFAKRIRLMALLQQSAYSDEAYRSWRNDLVATCCGQVQALNTDLAAVRYQLRYVEHFKDRKAYENLSDTDVGDVNRNVAPLIPADDDDEWAKRFDNFMYTLMLSAGESSPAFARGKLRLLKTIDDLCKKTSIDAVKKELPFMQRVRDEAFWADVSLLSLEEVRQRLRYLVQYLDGGGVKTKIIKTDLDDPTIGVREGDILLPAEEEPYKERVNHYFEAHLDNPAVQKLVHNEPITQEDYDELCRIFTEELGTQAEYDSNFPGKTFGLVVRNIAKMDKDAAEKAFSEFIDEGLNAKQIAFVRKVILYIANNGYMDNTRALIRPPFDRPYKMNRIFNQKQIQDIMTIINTIRDNATVR